MNLRIAIGRCECREPYRDPIEAKACDVIAARIRSWQERLPGDLRALPAEFFERERVEGHWITLGTFKRDTESQDTLVVFQALVHTWRRPTFFALGAVGRIYAEGLVVSSDGGVRTAPAEMLWEFR